MANTLDIQLKLSDDGTVEQIQAKLKDGFQKIEQAASDSAKKANGAWAQLSQTIKDHSQAMEAVGKGFAVLGGSISAFMGVAIHEASISEQSNLKLVQSIKLAGLELQSSSKQVKEFATSMQKLTGTTDETVQDFVARMLPITNDVGKAMDATRLAMDLAAATGRDLSSVEQIMTQVLNGNVEVLRRMVPAMKDYTSQQFADMTATQRTAIAIAELRKQFGGMAQAEGQSAAGQLRILKAVTSDLMEEIGGVLLPGLVRFAQNMKEIVLGVTEWMKAHQILADVLVKTISVLGLFMIAMAPVLLAIPTLATSINVALIPAFRALFTVIMTHPIGALVVAIGGLIAAGVQLAATYINTANDQKKAVQMGKEMLDYHKQEAAALREAIRQNKDHLDTETNSYQTREAMINKYMQLRKTIEFQEKQLHEDAKIRTAERFMTEDQLRDRIVANRQLALEINQNIAESGKQTMTTELAAATAKYAGLRVRLDKWHKEEKALANLQGKDMGAVEKDFSEKSKALAKAEEDAKRKIKQDAQKAALNDLVSNLQELSKHSETAFEFFKATAIAQTIISTYEGATKAYTAMASIPIVGPALGAAAAAVAIAAGLSRVASISAQQRPTMHTGGEVGSVGDVPITAQSGEYVIRREVAQKNLPLLQKINEGASIPQNFQITFNHYGDIRTEADREELYKELGIRIRNVLRGT